ncbi:MAG: universal stress protein, partial [Bacteroidota bacterium]
MKTLLVPTDFSEASNNAIDYAVEIARVTHAKLILFHAYHVPVITTEAVVAIPEFKELEQYALDNLKKAERTIQIKHGSAIVTECICKCGFPVEEIIRFTKGHNIDMIVMGMKGAG